MPKYKTVSIRMEEYQKLQKIAAKLGITVSGLIRILASSLEVEEDGDTIHVYLVTPPKGLRPSKVFVIPFEEYWKWKNGYMKLLKLLQEKGCA